MRDLHVTFQKKKKKIDMARLESLALPVVRDLPEMRDPFAVDPDALTYTITKRIESLAVPKFAPEIEARIPGAVSAGALKAIGNVSQQVAGQ